MLCSSEKVWIASSKHLKVWGLWGEGKIYIYKKKIATAKTVFWKCNAERELKTSVGHLLCLQENGCSDSGLPAHVSSPAAACFPKKHFKSKLWEVNGVSSSFLVAKVLICFCPHTHYLFRMYSRGLLLLIGLDLCQLSDVGLRNAHEGEGSKSSNGWAVWIVGNSGSPLLVALFLQVCSSDTVKKEAASGKCDFLVHEQLRAIFMNAVCNKLLSLVHVMHMEKCSQVVGWLHHVLFQVVCGMDRRTEYRDWIKIKWKIFRSLHKYSFLVLYNLCS